jgi:hypothetical protein
MHIIKFCLAVCAAAIFVLPFLSRADDTDAQIKAREALRQKMNELQGTPPESAPTNPAPAPKKARTNSPPVVKPAPAAVQQNTPPAPAPPAPAAGAASTAKSEAMEKAREATRQKMLELQAQQPPEPVAPPPVAANPEPVTKPAVSAVQPKPEPAPIAKQPAPAPAPPVAKATPTAVRPAPTVVKQNTPPAVAQPAPKADSVAMEKAREATRQKMLELQAQEPPEPVTPAPVVATPQPITRPGLAPAPTFRPRAETPSNVSKIEPRPRPGAEPAQAAVKPKPQKVAKKDISNRPPSFKNPEGPASPFSTDKQQQLSELLRKYQADEITPEQYHQERAKILAAQ